VANCIIINRVSAADQRDGYSLSAQSRHGNEYANGLGIKVVQEFTFQESASKSSEQRQFDEFLKFIATYTKNHTDPLHVVVEKKDRWGRLHSRRVYHLYSCTNGKKVHSSLAGRYISENELMEQFAPAMRAVAIDNHFTAAIRTALRTNHASLRTKMMQPS